MYVKVGHGATFKTKADLLAVVAAMLVESELPAW